MPRFVVLRHETPLDANRPSHYDLMFELDTVLRTWAVPDVPTATDRLQAELLADHRLAYLDYEGPISGDRGSVSRWDSGQYVLVRDSDDQWTVRVSGNHWRGELSLRLEDAARRSWSVQFVPG